MRIDKQELLRVLRTRGDNHTADRVAGALTDEIDTDRDGETLSSLGLDRTQLMAKLASGGSGGTPGPLGKDPVLPTLRTLTVGPGTGPRQPA